MIETLERPTVELPVFKPALETNQAHDNVVQLPDAAADLSSLPIVEAPTPVLTVANVPKQPLLQREAETAKEVFSGIGDSWRGLRGRVRHVWQGLREDVREIRKNEGKGVSWGLGALAIATTVYQFGGLEASVATVGSKVYEVTGNPFVGAAAMAATSVVVEVGLTKGWSGFLKRAPKMTAAFVETKYDGQEPDVTERKGLKAKVSNGISKLLFLATLGSPGAMAYSYAHEPEAPTAEHTKSGLKAAGALGALNFAIGTAVLGGSAGVAHLAEKVFDSPEKAEMIVEHAQDPKTWLMALGIVVGAHLGNSVSERVKRARETVASRYAIRPPRHRATIRKRPNFEGNSRQERSAPKHRISKERQKSVRSHRHQLAFT
jgi:hypothetical protein